MQNIVVVNAKDGVFDAEGLEKVSLMLDTAVSFVELMWPLQDRLKLRDAKDDLAACTVNARGKFKFINSNFSLLQQGFLLEGLCMRFLCLHLFFKKKMLCIVSDTIAVLPLKHVGTLLQAKASGSSIRKGTVRGGAGTGSAPGTPTT